MRRVVVLIAGLGAVGALVLAPGSGSIVRGARAEAAECLWHRHSRRVVKHVRRHGRSERVARIKHWWTCDGAPVASPAPPPVAPLIPPAEPEPEANRLSVKADEYSYVLSRPQTRAGQVIVELNNQGEDPHNLNLQREGGEEPVFQIPKTGSLQHLSASFELPAGTYRLWCSLPTHDEKGMHATLVVEGG